MICKNIRAIIDAFPAHEWERHQHDRVNRHVAKCVDCRSALIVANALDAGLRRLPNPAPPAGLAGRIMARTARLEEVPVATPGASSRDTTKITAENAARDVLAWTAALGGAAIALGSQLALLIRGEVPVALTPLTIGGWSHLIEMPDASITTLMLAAGLCLCVAGFLASLRERSFQKDGTGQNSAIDG
jgi:hypothetical protein